MSKIKNQIERPEHQDGLSNDDAKIARTAAWRLGELVVFPLKQEFDLLADGFKFGLVGKSNPNILLDVETELDSIMRTCDMSGMDWTIEMKRPKKTEPGIKSDFDRRVEALEREVGIDNMPGTQICRVSDPDGDGYLWSIGIGALCCPKEFFLGKTIDEAMMKAENAVNARKAENRKPVITDMDKLAETFSKNMGKSDRKQPR